MRINRRKISRTLLWISSIIFCFQSAFGQSNSNDQLMEFLKGKDPLVDRVLNQREQFRFQFIFTQVNKQNESTNLETFDYSTDDYFYPASVVKLPTALLTLEALNNKGVSRNAILKIQQDQYCGNMTYIERTKARNLSFEKMLRELIVVSDNHYYNALYHFLTPKRINSQLKQHGLLHTKIYRSFTGCELPKSLFCNSFKVYEPAGTLQFSQNSSQLPFDEFSNQYKYDSTKLLGAKHEYRRKIVSGPFDFNYNLEYPLNDIHGSMLRLCFPEQFSSTERWNIRAEDREFLLESMRQVPKNLGGKFSDQKKYPDNLYKYVVHGVQHPDYRNIISTSKIGISYGFVTETAHIKDPQSGKEYVLTASIYVNANDTVNDGDYEYDEIARPFLAKLGQLLLEFQQSK